MISRCFINERTKLYADKEELVQTKQYKIVCARSSPHLISSRLDRIQIRCQLNI